MDNRNCTDVREELPWLVNGSLPSHRQHELWQHLGACPACRTELVAWARLAARVRAAAVDAPPAVLAAAWQAIHRRTGKVRQNTNKPTLIAAVSPPLTIAGDVLRWAVTQAMRQSDAALPRPFPLS